MLTVRPIPHHFLFWFLFLPIWLIEVPLTHWILALPTLYDPTRVQHVTATVTVAAIAQGTGGNGSVQYIFRLPGDSTLYTTGSPFFWNQGIAYNPVTPEALQHALQHGTIDVLYHPDDPKINIAAAHRGDTVIGSLCIWGLTLPFDVFWLIETYVMMRDFRRCQAAAERGQARRMHFWMSKPG